MARLRAPRFSGSAAFLDGCLRARRHARSASGLAIIRQFKLIQKSESAQRAIKKNRGRRPPLVNTGKGGIAKLDQTKNPRKDEQTQATCTEPIIRTVTRRLPCETYGASPHMIANCDDPGPKSGVLVVGDDFNL